MNKRNKTSLTYIIILCEIQASIKPYAEGQLTKKKSSHKGNSIEMYVLTVS